jgi:hypothetical protein
MARKIRIEYRGDTYQVMARGNQGRDIYADDQDRNLWFEPRTPTIARMVPAETKRWSSFS